VNRSGGRFYAPLLPLPLIAAILCLLDPHPFCCLFELAPSIPTPHATFPAPAILPSLHPAYILSLPSTSLPPASAFTGCHRRAMAHLWRHFWRISGCANAGPSLAAARHSLGVWHAYRSVFVFRTVFGRM